MLSLLFFFFLCLCCRKQNQALLHHFIPQRTIHKHSEATLNFPQISFCRFHCYISMTITTNLCTTHSFFITIIIVISISKLDTLSGFQDYISIKISSKFLLLIPSLEALSSLQSTNAGVVAANLPPNLSLLSPSPATHDGWTAYQHALCHTLNYLGKHLPHLSLCHVWPRKARDIWNSNRCKFYPWAIL